MPLSANLPLYTQIAIGILVAVLLLALASMLRGLIERIITAALQLVRYLLGTLERIVSAPFRALGR